MTIKSIFTAHTDMAIQKQIRLYILIIKILFSYYECITYFLISYMLFFQNKNLDNKTELKKNVGFISADKCIGQNKSILVV